MQHHHQQHHYHQHQQQHHQFFDVHQTKMLLNQLRPYMMFLEVERFEVERFEVEQFEVERFDNQFQERFDDQNKERQGNEHQKKEKDKEKEKRLQVKSLLTRPILQEREREKEREDQKKEREREREEDQRKEDERNNRYRIGQQLSDPLFWCWYVMHHGQFQYEMDIRHQSFSIEKKAKYDAVEMLRKPEMKDLLRQYQLRPFLTLENELANEPRISVKTFFAMCLVYQHNVLLIDGRKVFELMANDSPIVHVVHQERKPIEEQTQKEHNKNNKRNRDQQIQQEQKETLYSYSYWIEQQVSPEVLTKYRTLYYRMPTFETKLKAIGSYTLADLKELAEQLSIHLGDKKITKLVLYDLIQKAFI